MEIKEELDQDLIERIKSQILDIEENHLHKIAPQGVVLEILSAVRHYIR